MYSLKINLIGCDEQVMPTAARDTLRRWAIMDADYPNVTAILKNVLMKEGETRLFIVFVDSAGAVADLKRLNAMYPRYPILAVVDGTNDPTLVVKSMRAGALQVISPPVASDDLNEALDCVAAKHEGMAMLAKVVTVTCSVGGCGGTTVAINLAYELSRLVHARCILMELSLRRGVLANHLGISPRYTTTDLVTDMHRMDTFILQAALTEVAENFSVLAGPYKTIQTKTANLEHTMQLVQLTRHLASWLILDVPGSYDDLFFQSLMAADRIVLVADQTVAAIRGVQLVCETLGPRRPLVVINRYNRKNEGLSKERIQGFLPSCDLCTLAKDWAVVESMNSGQPLRLYAPSSPVLADLDALLKMIIPDAEMNGKHESILTRLGRALSFS
jgi:pilus assembly protein CpaE